MKKCPRCKKNVDDKASKCPHCGYNLTNRYQPMKRGTPPSQGKSIIFLAILMIISPLIISTLFSPSSNEVSSREPKDAITLGKLGKVDANKEQSRYLFDSLDSYDKKVTNVDKYVENIKSFEKNLKKIVDKYVTNKIDKTYQIYITDEENVYYYLTYQITMNNQSMMINLEYDLSGKTNNTQVAYYVNNFNDFETMKLNDGSYPMFKEVLGLISGENSDKLVNQTGKDFNKLENQFEKQNKNLGSYGIGVSKAEDEATCVIRVLADNDKYTLRLSFDTKINLKQFN